MVKYTSDTNLIRGAAAAYKDWSNMPGMYEGLDKLGAAGKKAVDDDIKERNDTIDKINNAAEEALVRMGGLGKNHYDYSFDLVNKFKRDYWEGVKSKDEKKKMDALMLLNNHIEEVADLKALNADYSKLHIDKDLTSAMNNETYKTSDGVYTSRNKVLTNMLNNNYTVSENKEGQRVYTMDIDGTKHSITKYQYERLTSLKNYEFGNTFDKQVQRGYQSPITNLESFESNILKSLPDDEFGMEGIIADGLRGEHLEGLVRKYITPDMVAQKAFGKIFDTDTEVGISGDEYENFIDAILNFSGPNKNEFSNVGNTKKIIAEVAALHGKELNDLHWAAKLRSRQQQDSSEEQKYQIAKGVYLTEAQIKSNIQDILNASSGTQIPRSDGFGSLEKRGGQWYERTYKTNTDGEQVPSERRISVDDAITIQGYSGWYNKKDSSEKTFDWTRPYKIIANL